MKKKIVNSADELLQWMLRGKLGKKTQMYDVLMNECKWRKLAIIWAWDNTRHRHKNVNNLFLMLLFWYNTKGVCIELITFSGVNFIHCQKEYSWNFHYIIPFFIHAISKFKPFHIFLRKMRRKQNIV